MWVFVRLFRCLLIRVSLCFLGWLVVWVYGLCVFVCFSGSAAHFRGLLSVLGSFLVLFLHCSDFETPLSYLGLLFATFGGSFCMFLVLGGALGHLGAQFANF